VNFFSPAYLGERHSNQQRATDKSAKCIWSRNPRLSSPSSASYAYRIFSHWLQHHLTHLVQADPETWRLIGVHPGLQLIYPIPSLFALMTSSSTTAI